MGGWWDLELWRDTSRERDKKKTVIRWQQKCRWRRRRGKRLSLSLSLGGNKLGDHRADKKRERGERCERDIPNFLPISCTLEIGIATEAATADEKGMSN